MTASFQDPRGTLTGDERLDRIRECLGALVRDLNGSPRIVASPAAKVVAGSGGNLNPGAVAFTTASPVYVAATDGDGASASVTLRSLRRGDRVFATLSSALQCAGPGEEARAKLFYLDGGTEYEGSMERVGLFAYPVYGGYTETYEVTTDGDLTVSIFVKRIVGTAYLMALSSLSVIAVRSPNG